MAEEPRRSGRATKGQHTKTASSSPAPQPKPTKQPGKPKASKKSQLEQAEPAEDFDEEEEEKIRCICGDDNPKDRRAFIECEACQVWQHNVCMGMPDDDDDLPDHYFCEECSPDEHGETLAALANGEKIWETRNRIYQNEKKAGQKRKGKSGRPGWLKKDVQPDGEQEEEVKEEAVEEPESAGSKRKRGEEMELVEQQDVKVEPEERSTRGSRQEKRRKAAVNGDGAATATTTAAPEAADPDTALVDIDELPMDRHKIATALGKIISEDVQSRAQSGAYRIPDGHTAKSLGEYHAVRIEYAMKMNHEGSHKAPYAVQFRALHNNLRWNKVLITRLLDGSLTADELSVMESKDMASAELQKQNALLKEQADRQAIAVQEEGPRYRRTHKGDELIEDENAMLAEGSKATQAQPVRERASIAGEGSPTTDQQPFAVSPVGAPLAVETKRSTSQTQTGLEQRRTSSQQFDMNDIWAKTAQSPTSTTATRPMQMPPRRSSSNVKAQLPDSSGAGGTKEDADVDRMLQDDDDETYSPAEYAEATPLTAVVWRGKLIQSADGVSPTVNARFVAGRDLTPTVSWRDLLPTQLSIDGRLQIARAEEYLCSLQWSQSSDVSVLALTPYDDAEGFEAVFKYFKSRERYAVVNKDKPPMVKDLYIIPVDQGQELPSHVGMLEFNRLGNVVGEKCLLASLVVGRAVGTPPVSQTTPQQTADISGVIPGANGQQHTLPQHMRGGPGPAGSPLNTSSATFSPPMAADPSVGLPPNPYTVQPAVSANPLVNEILGSLQFAPTAQQVVSADPNIARDKLVHLKRILEDDPRARTDLGALAAQLNAGTL